MLIEHVEGRNQHLRSVRAFGPHDIWAAGFTNWTVITDDGFYLRYALTEARHWDGTQWMTATPPNPSPWQNLVWSLDGVVTDDLWAVGEYQADSGARYRSLLLHWDGAQWSHMEAPHVRVGSNRLRVVAAVASDDVWAVGQVDDSAAEARTLILHWDGTIWSVVPSPNGAGSRNELKAVAAVTAYDVWAVGHSDSQSLVLHWDGAAWQVVPLPEAMQAGVLTAVAAVTTNDIWAAGTKFLHWNGVAWQEAVSPLSGQVEALHAVSATDIWAVGEGAARWDGTHWTMMDAPRPGAYDTHLNGVAAVAPHDVWMVGDYKEYFEDDWRSLATRRYDPCPATHPTPTWTAPPTLTPAPTWTPTPTPTPKSPCSSSWDIVDIRNPSTALHDLHDVAALAPDNVWAVGEYGGWNLVLNWNGIEWQYIPTGQYGALRSVVALASDDIWAVGDGGIVHWDGLQWSRVPEPVVSTTGIRVYRGIAAVTASDMWIVGGVLDGPSWRPVTLHWNGQAWTLVPSPSFSQNIILSDVAVVSGTDVWAVAGDWRNRAILHWDGLTWSVVDFPPGVPASSALRSVTARAANDVWAVGDYVEVSDEAQRTRPLILHYDGNVWTMLSVDVDAETAILEAVTSLGPKDAWAVGHQDSQTLIVHWDGTEWSVSPSPNVEVGLDAEQNFLYAVGAVSVTDVWAVGSFWVSDQWSRRSLAQHFTRTPCP